MGRAAVSQRFLSTAMPPKKPSAPRFQVPVHIALFTVLMIPVGLSMGYASHFGKKEDDLEAEIRARYQAKMDDSGIAEKNRHMGAYFQQVFDNKNKNKEVEQQLRSILEGGKDAHTKGRQRKYDELGEKLRQTAVAAPVSALEDEEEESNSGKQKKRKKKKKRKADDDEKAVPSEVKTTLSSSTVASVTAIAAVAAVTGFVLGGSRKSS